MKNINIILANIEEDIKEMESFKFEEVYDGDGKRDYFQEGYNFGCLQTLKELVARIKS